MKLTCGCGASIETSDGPSSSRHREANMAESESLRWWRKVHAVCARRWQEEADFRSEANRVAKAQVTQEEPHDDPCDAA